MDLRKEKQVPGTMMYTGEYKGVTVLQHVKYNDTVFDVYDTLQPLDEEVVDWLIVEGLTNTELIEKICKDKNVDSLVIEDILHVNQRTKVEVHNEYMFAVFKYSYLEEEKIYHDYLSMLVFDDMVITFSETKHRFTEDVLARIKNPKSFIRGFRHDYLFYVLYDMIVDESIAVTRVLQTNLNELELEILELDDKDQVRIYKIRKELVFIRNMSVQLLQDLRQDKLPTIPFIEQRTLKFYGDIYDHLMNMNSQVTTLNELARNILDVYMNNMSNRMNQIMTTLTIFSAIFIPLSFIAGVFGMNFTNFPILTNPNGMLYFALICVFIPVVMLVYFKRKNWY